MGYSLSWIAVPAHAREGLLDLLQQSPTGRFEEVPEAAACGIALPSDWYAVVRNRDEPTAADGERLARLSRTAGVIACFVEEHVMASWARGWSGGTLAWSVVHDSQAGPRRLNASGDLPPAYPDVPDRLLARQDADPEGAGYRFDAPVELAERMTGFRHDVAPAGCGDDPFEVLAPRKVGRRRWFF